MKPRRSPGFQATLPPVASLSNELRVLSIEPAPNQPPPPGITVLPAVHLAANASRATSFSSQDAAAAMPQHPNPGSSQQSSSIGGGPPTSEASKAVASRLQLVRRLPKQTLIRAGEKDPNIWGMSYNSARDELFLADKENSVVRAMRVRDNAGDLRDVYRAPHDTEPSIYSVCHMSDSDTLLVCSYERGPDGKGAKWLVALSRNGSEWREAQRVQTDGMGVISCALSD